MPTDYSPAPLFPLLTYTATNLTNTSVLAVQDNWIIDQSTAPNAVSLFLPQSSLASRSLDYSQVPCILWSTQLTIPSQSLHHSPGFVIHHRTRCQVSPPLVYCSLICPQNQKRHEIVNIGYSSSVGLSVDIGPATCGFTGYRRLSIVRLVRDRDDVGLSRDNCTFSVSFEVGLWLMGTSREKN